MLYQNNKAGKLGRDDIMTYMQYAYIHVFMMAVKTAEYTVLFAKYSLAILVRCKIDLCIVA